MSNLADSSARSEAPDPRETPNLLTADLVARWQGLPVAWAPTPTGAWQSRFETHATSVALLDTGTIGTRIQTLGRSSDLDLKAGDLALFEPDTEVRVAQTGSMRARRILVELDPTPKPGSLLSGDELLQVPLRPGTGFRDESLALVLRAMLREILDGCPNGLLFAQSLSMGVALHLRKTRGLQHLPATTERGKLSEHQLACVNELIEESLTDDLSLPALAQALDLSKAHFVRLFRNSVGTSPHRYVMQRRVERARVLLLSSDLSLVEVAIDAGFASQSHMTRVFRQVFGITPGDARRQAGRRRYLDE